MAPATQVQALGKSIEIHGALRIERRILGDRPCVAIYRGKGFKPIANYSFKTLERADAFVVEAKQKEAERVAYIATRKAERSAKAAAFVMPYKVGDVLHGSWGYDQTNCEFFEILDILGKRAVVIRELKHVHVAGSAGSMSESVIADRGADRFHGSELRKIVGVDGYVRLHTSCSLHAWDGRPCYSSWYA